MLQRKEGCSNGAEKIQETTGLCYSLLEIKEGPEGCSDGKKETHATLRHCASVCCIGRKDRKDAAVRQRRHRRHNATLPEFAAKEGQTGGM